MMTTMNEVWTAEQLMGVNGTEESLGTTTKKNGKTVVLGKGVDKDPLLWGAPGHLSNEETTVFFQFKDEIESRGGEFKETVFSFGEVEGECWAITRWLRARKFVLADVITMVEEATQVRKEAKEKNFYENPVEALGVEPNLFFAQYPQLYSGSTKKGVPVFISKPGILNVDGMECITTLDGIIKFHWHIMMHDFTNRLHKEKEKNPDGFKKFECFCVLDLDNLTTSQLNRRALAIIKEQAAIDSVCFPETMSKMLIINAPTFFSASWRLIKGWLDPRTASKIEVISSRSTAEERLLEFIDSEHLPSDYGGTGPTTDVIMNSSSESMFGKLETQMLYVRGYGSEKVDLLAGETAELSIFTRSTAGATFSVMKGDTTIVSGVNVVDADGNPNVPTKVVILETGKVTGPATLKVKADSKGSRFSTHNFLLVASFKK